MQGFKFTSKSLKPYSFYFLNFFIGILKNFPYLLWRCSTRNFLKVSFILTLINKVKCLLVLLPWFPQDVFLVGIKGIFNSFSGSMWPFSTSSQASCDPSKAFICILQFSKLSLLSRGTWNGNIGVAIFLGTMKLWYHFVWRGCYMWQKGWRNFWKRVNQHSSYFLNLTFDS